MEDPRLRAAFGYSLYAGVEYQTGDGTDAPTLVYADADYEVGDGKCGLHESGKQANEPTIVYVRADNYLRALDEIETLRDALHEYGDRAKMGKTLRAAVDAYTPSPPIPAR